MIYKLTTWLILFTFTTSALPAELVWFTPPQATAMRICLPKASATFCNVESRTSSAWFSIREITDFVVPILFARTSWETPFSSLASRMNAPTLNSSYPKSNSLANFPSFALRFAIALSKSSITHLLMLITSQIIPLPLFHQINLHSGSLLILLGKTIRQHHPVPAMKEPQQPENIIPHLNPHLPQIIRSLHLLKILTRHCLQLLHQLQNPEHLQSLFVIQTLQEIIHRGSSRLRLVKINPPHEAILANKRTLSNSIFEILYPKDGELRESRLRTPDYEVVFNAQGKQQGEVKETEGFQRWREGEIAKAKEAQKRAEKAARKRAEKAFLTGPPGGVRYDPPLAGQGAGQVAGGGVSAGGGVVSNAVQANIIHAVLEATPSLSSPGKPSECL